MIILTAEEINRLANNFCIEQMWEKNMICRSLTENFPESCASLNKCPLYLFKLHLMEKAKEGENGL